MWSFELWRSQNAIANGTAGTPLALTYLFRLPLRLLLQLAKTRNCSDLPRGGVEVVVVVIEVALAVVAVVIVVIIVIVIIIGKSSS